MCWCLLGQAISNRHFSLVKHNQSGLEAALQNLAVTKSLYLWDFSNIMSNKARGKAMKEAR